MAFGLALLLLFLGSLTSSGAAPPLAPISQAAPETADYLGSSLRLLFPSLPANIELQDVTEPDFPSNTLSTDYFPLGVLSNLYSAADGVQPITKTLQFNFKGGVRGRIFSYPAWLAATPNYFANRNGQGQLDSVVGVRQDAATGAGLLPAQQNWGQMQIELNGFVFDYSATVLVGSPKNVTKDSGDNVFKLYNQILGLLDQHGDISSAIGTVAHPNGSQFALGLVVDYLGESEYDHRMSEADFESRVAETLAEKDYNNDAWIGFTKQDILVGAPGWVLGRATTSGGDAQK